MHSTAPAICCESSNLCPTACSLTLQYTPNRKAQSCGGERAASSRLQCDSELACGRHRRLGSHCSVDTQMRQRAAHLASKICLAEGVQCSQSDWLSQLNIAALTLRQTEHAA